VIYLITFACYGAHLQGDDSGSIDRHQNRFASPTIEPNRIFLSRARHNMSQPSYTMDQTRRDSVLASIIERCRDCKWQLIAAHVRTNHVHVIVGADPTPERIMNDLKAYASRILNGEGFDTPDRKRWARHGSTRRLWDREQVENAVNYVAARQGEPMALFVADLY
jgi:REP element-mobilizing transposase RayT